MSDLSLPDINSLDTAREVIAKLSLRLQEAERDLALLKAARGIGPGLMLFALDSSRAMGEKIAAAMNTQLQPHTERYHPDGELYVRPNVNVRRSSAFVIQSLYGDDKETVHDKIAKLRYFVGALRDASASEVTAVVPYMAYARSDRKVKSREPVITKYLACELEAVGVDRLITMDIHSLQAYQNAYRTCRTDNLTCRVEFAEYFARRLAVVPPSDISVLTPDAGGLSRCVDFAGSLRHRLGGKIGVAWLDKQHDADDSEIKTAHNIVGDICPVMIILDDMFATCGTAALAANVAREKGVKQVWIAATHGLFCGKANQVLKECEAIHKVVVSDTIVPFRLDTEVIKSKLEIVTTVGLWAQAIQRTFTGESLSSMFGV